MSDAPDPEDLSRLFFGVRRGGDDEKPIKQVDGDAMRALIVCSADTESKNDEWIFSVLHSIFIGTH